MEEILKSYRLLGVEPGASQEQIKKAYRDLVKKWHPDQFATDPGKREEAEQKLRAINLAFEKLQEAGSTFDLVAALRATYGMGAAGQPSPPPPPSTPSFTSPPTDPTISSPRHSQPNPQQSDRPTPRAPLDARPERTRRKWADHLRRPEWQWAVAVALLLGVTAWALFFGEVRSTDQRRARAPGRVDVNASKSSMRIPGDVSASTQIGGRSSGPAAFERSQFPGDVGSGEDYSTEAGSLVGIKPRSSLTSPSEQTLATTGTGSDSELGERPSAVRVKSEAAAASQSQATEPETSADAQFDSELQFRMGVRYAQGDGVPQDFSEAAKWYRRAAEAGHVQAKKSLAFLYASGKGVPRDFDEAEQWFRSASEKMGTQDAFAGALLSVARSESEDEKARAGELSTKSTAAAQFDLGQRYLKGAGVPRDYVEAAKWFRLAAEAGHALAQRNLGYLYLHGRGVELNRAEAEKWLRKAAQQGLSGAELTTAILSMEKPITEKQEVPQTNTTDGADLPVDRQ